MHNIPATTTQGGLGEWGMDENFKEMRAPQHGRRDATKEGANEVNLKANLDRREGEGRGGSVGFG